MRRIAILVGGLAMAAALSTQAYANADLYSVNGLARLGVNDDGSLDASTNTGYMGLGYNFSGFGFRDALTPGCACEAWGVAGNGASGYVGQSVGNNGIVVGLSSTGTSTNTANALPVLAFTSNTSFGGLSITQTFAVGAENGAGALFKDKVTIANTTGSKITDVRFGRAMDWDVPPTEFSEHVTIVGTGTTATLLHSTDNGFSNADPIGAMGDGGIIGPVDSDGSTGPADHGSLFIFGFGDLDPGASYTFNIFYGAAGDRAGALSLLGLISPELYSLGQSHDGLGGRADDMPTYIFAFNGVGGTVVVPGGVPEPATWAMMLIGFAGLAMVGARRRRSVVA